MMKKLYTILLIIIFIGAQYTAEAGGKNKFGIRAGYQAANLYNSDGLSGYGNINTFYVGFYRDFKFAPLLYLGAGMDYYQNGTVKDSDNKIALHYLSVPLYLKLKVGPFFALAGAGANFKIHEKWTIKGISETPPSEIKSNGFDLPVFAGVGLKFAFITIEARYYYGTMDVNGEALSGFEGAHNTFLQLGLGLSI